MATVLLLVVLLAGIGLLLAFVRGVTGSRRARKFADLLRLAEALCKTGQRKEALAARSEAWHYAKQVLLGYQNDDDYGNAAQWSRWTKEGLAIIDSLLYPPIQVEPTPRRQRIPLPLDTAAHIIRETKATRICPHCGQRSTLTAPPSTFYADCPKCHGQVYVGP